MCTTCNVQIEIIFIRFGCFSFALFISMMCVCVVYYTLPYIFVFKNSPSYFIITVSKGVKIWCFKKIVYFWIGDLCDIQSYTFCVFGAFLFNKYRQIFICFFLIWSVKTAVEFYVFAVGVVCVIRFEIYSFVTHRLDGSFRVSAVINYDHIKIKCI